MKGIHVTEEQHRFHDALCNMVGCICCRKIGHFNDWCSIHHIAGRSKPSSHWLVIPLCGEHHQTGPIARHRNKAQFEEAFGDELELLSESVRLLLSSGYKGKVCD